MFERKVTKIVKDSQGDILALCNPFEYWSPRLKQDVVMDIESNLYYYYVEVKGSGIVSIVVEEGTNGKYLRTSSDKITLNNLDILPYCEI